MGWKKGDVIMTSEPYAHVLASRHRAERCSYCFLRNTDLKRCTACTQLRYCGRKCQKADWSVHKLECQCLKRVAPNTPTDSVLLMLRLVLKYLSGDHLKKVEGDPGWRTFADLMSHAEEIKQDPQRCDAFAKICHTLSLLAGSHISLPSSTELLDIFGKMVINTITIADEELHESLGAGIYLRFQKLSGSSRRSGSQENGRIQIKYMLARLCNPPDELIPSMLDHRCEPNAIITFQGKSLRLAAVQDVSCNSEREVTDKVFLSYIDQLAPSWERQTRLKEQYYFLCTCPRCADASLDKMMTANTQEKREASEEDGSLVTDSTAVAVKACQELLSNVSQMRKAGEGEEQILSVCEECLSKVKHHLPAFNVSHLQALDCALDAAVSCGRWEQALSYGIETLQPYRILYPAMSPNTGLQLMRVGKLQLYLEHFQDAYISLREAEKILSVTHGHDSSLFHHLTDLLDQCPDS